MKDRKKPEPLLQGPFTRPDESRFWRCRVDSRGRIRIPQEIMEELGWRVGDQLAFEILEQDGRKILHVWNPDALAPLTDDEGEVREITEEDMEHALRFHQLPEGLQRKLKGNRESVQHPTEGEK